MRLQKTLLSKLVDIPAIFLFNVKALESSASQLLDWADPHSAISTDGSAHPHSTACIFRQSILSSYACQSVLQFILECPYNIHCFI